MHNDKLNKLYALINAGMPGVWRVLTLLLINTFEGIVVAGYYASALALAQFITSFTAMGFFNLSLVKLGKLNEKEKFWWQIMVWVFALTLTACSIIVLYIMTFKYAFISNFYYFFCLSIALFIYHAGRHVAMGYRLYKIMLIAEFFSLLLVSILYLVGISFFILSIIWPIVTGLILIIYFISKHEIVPFHQIKDNLLHIWKENLSKGVALGLSFIFGGGSLLILPWIAEQISGVNTSAFVGIALALMAPLMLLPRATAMYILPKISKAYHENLREFIQIYKHAINLNNKSVIVGTIFCILIVYIWLVSDDKIIFSFGYSLGLSFALLASIILIQVSMPFWLYINASEHQKRLLIYNVSGFLLFIILTIGYTLTFAHNEFIYISLFLIFSNTLRLYLMWLDQKKLYKKLLEEKKTVV